MESTGYINYKGEKYTYYYDNNILTLVITDPTKENEWFYHTEKVEYLKGYSSDGTEIFFYIDGKINKWSGNIKCYPRIVIYSSRHNCPLSKTNYSALKIRGGIVNNFYSNRVVFDGDVSNFHSEGLIRLKKLEQTAEEEKIIIDNKKASFQISVSYPPIKYGSGIKIGDFDSTIRLKYKKEWPVEDLIESIFEIDNLLFFCMNRKYFDYDKIALELRDSNGKFYEAAEIYIPNEINEEPPKFMLDYYSVKGKISKILKALNSVQYIIYNIPKTKREFKSISATRYASVFSVFQSLYNYCYSENNIVCDDKVFDDLKIEMIDSLKQIEEKYKGVDGSKRKYVNRFINIISKSNLKIESMIANEIKKNKFVLKILPDRSYIEIMKNYEDAVKSAVHHRDLITHSEVLAPDEVDLAVYLTIERLIYILIMRKAGIPIKSIKNIIDNLNSTSVI